MDALTVLLVEDNPGDVRLIEEALQENPNSGITLIGANCLAAALALLPNSHFDAILLDLGLPDAVGQDAFRQLTRKFPLIPIVITTGLDDETLAVNIVQEGAQDYLVKGQWSRRELARSLHYAVERQKSAMEKDRLIAHLKEALVQIRMLRGLLPICASCKKVRDDRGYWQQVEAYIQNHSEMKFTHSICPDCIRKLYPEAAGILEAAESKAASGGGESSSSSQSGLTPATQ
ncbi:MAG: response regulator [Lentisphaerae bacterium]|nr:response regulator [Lentisphaerota bacterium]